MAAQKQFHEAMSHRMHLDDSIELVGKLLFGIEKGPKVLMAVRPAGQPVVDDWQCLKTLVSPAFFLYHLHLCIIFCVVLYYWFFARTMCNFIESFHRYAGPNI